MEYFDIETIGKILSEPGKEHLTWRQLKLICQGGKVATIKIRPLFEKPKIVSPARFSNVMLDIERILNDEFWGDIYVDEIDNKPVNIWEEQVRKPRERRGRDEG